MLSQNDKVSIRQFQILLIIDILGTGVIMAPRRLSEYALQDGWIVMIISTLLALLLTFIMTSLATSFPHKSFTSYTSELVSKPVSIILSLGLIVKLMITVAIELRIFGEIVKNTMLYETPLWIIILSMLIISGYASAKGYETRGRIAEILILIIIIPIAIIFIISATEVDFSNIKPIGVTSQKSLLIGGVNNLISFTGIEFCLLSAPYLANKNKMRTASLVSVGITGAIMTIITILAISQFGYLDIQNRIFPVLDLMDTITLPGSFIERQEALMMSFWIASVFAIVNAGLFFSATIGKDCFVKGRHSIYILIASCIIFILSLIPNNIEEVLLYQETMFRTLTPLYVLVIPILLLLILKLRNLIKNRNNVNKTIKYALLLLIVSTTLTGCYDRIDLEDRSYILAIGLDSNNDNFSLTVSIANNKAFSGESSSSDKHLVTTTESSSISLAFEEIEKSLGDKLYLGHTKLIVIGESILNNQDYFKQVMNYFNNESKVREINRKIIMLTTQGKASDILNANMNEKSIPPIYVTEYYQKNKDDDFFGFRMDLGDINIDLSETGNVIIPKISANENGIEISGASLIKEYKLVDYIDENILKGYLWSKNQVNNVIINDENTNNSFLVKNTSNKINFYEDNNKLVCEFILKVDVEIKEETTDDIDQKVVADLIVKTINDTTNIFQNNYKTDGYGLLRELRKNRFDLYEKYKDNWSEEFQNIKIFPIVNINSINK